MDPVGIAIAVAVATTPNHVISSSKNSAEGAAFSKKVSLTIDSVRKLPARGGSLSISEKQLATKKSAWPAVGSSKEQAVVAKKRRSVGFSAVLRGETGEITSSPHSPVAVKAKKSANRVRTMPSGASAPAIPSFSTILPADAKTSWLASIDYPSGKLYDNRNSQQKAEQIGRQEEGSVATIIAALTTDILNFYSSPRLGNRALKGYSQFTALEPSGQKSLLQGGIQAIMGTLQRDGEAWSFNRLAVGQREAVGREEQWSAEPSLAINGLALPAGESLRSDSVSTLKGEEWAVELDQQCQHTSSLAQRPLASSGQRAFQLFTRLDQLI